VKVKSLVGWGFKRVPSEDAELERYKLYPPEGLPTAGAVHERAIPFWDAEARSITSEMSGPPESAGAGAGAVAVATSTGGLAKPTDRDIASILGSASDAIPSSGA